MNQPVGGKAFRPPQSTTAGMRVAWVSFLLLLAAFWLAARVFTVDLSLGGHFAPAFTSFGLLLAPYWFFGFGVAGLLRHYLHRRWQRLLAPALLVIPYLVFSISQGDLRGQYVAAFIAVPVAVTAIYEFAPPPARLSWQDILVLLTVGLPVEFGWFREAWSQRGLGAMPKLLLVDAALYAFLVVRDLPNIGYDLRPRWRDLKVGMREWAFFAPIGIGLGLALGFIRLHAYLPPAATVLAGWLITFFFVALPEELYFRGLLQNLVEKALDRRIVTHARWWALMIAAPIFGLSHFNKPGPFNWRYVLLATIAGVLYGRAWRDRQRLLCSAITHATVDVVWSVWFR